MSDYINRRDAIKSVIRELQMDSLEAMGVRYAINSIPSADVIEPKRGEWKPFDLTWGRSIWYCTACEESTEVPCDIWEHKPIYKYCPNCGADMRKDSE